MSWLDDAEREAQEEKTAADARRQQSLQEFCQHARLLAESLNIHQNLKILFGRIMDKDPEEILVAERLDKTFSVYYEWSCSDSEMRYSNDRKWLNNEMKISKIKIYPANSVSPMTMAVSYSDETSVRGQRKTKKLFISRTEQISEEGLVSSLRAVYKDLVADELQRSNGYRP
jgi:hypothetical protein